MSRVALAFFGLLFFCSAQSLQWYTTVGGYKAIAGDPYSALKSACQDFVYNKYTVNYPHIVVLDSIPLYKQVSEVRYKGNCAWGYWKENSDGDTVFNGTGVMTDQNVLALICEPGDSIETDDDGNPICRKYCSTASVSSDFCTPEPEYFNCANQSDHPINFNDGRKLRTQKFATAGRVHPIIFEYYYNNRSNNLLTESGYNTEKSYQTQTIIKEYSPGYTLDKYSSPLASFSTVSVTDNEISTSGIRFNGDATQYWRHSYSYFLDTSFYSSGRLAKASLYSPKGDIDWFEYGSSDQKPGYKLDYTRDSSDEYRRYSVTIPGEPKRYFDDEGRLRIVEYSEGIEHTLEYNDDSQLTSITHSDGSIIKLIYVDGTLKRVKYPNGVVVLEWRYKDVTNGYSSTVVTNNELYKKFPVLFSAKYYYRAEFKFKRVFKYNDENWPAALTSIYDYDPAVSSGPELYAEFEYDDEGRAVYSSLRDGVESVSVEYPDEDTRVVTNALGRDTTYTYGTVNSSRALLSIDGEAVSSCQQQNITYTYYSSGRVKSITWEGVTNTYPDSDTGGTYVSASGSDVETHKNITIDTTDILKRPSNIEYETYSEDFEYTDGNLTHYEITPDGWE
ncbi:hypothetical protein [Oceanobacter mangrovi]|uniref:hypothetical protein n=1 Tax=Oceanobacter mangrovi TaxID=2862510 RepID=UPI001C8D546A|nr:hypothetical protein [Oceanobacter mangrovi]